MLKLVDNEEAVLREVNRTIISAAVVNLINSNEFWKSLVKLVKMIEFPAKIIGKLEESCASLSLSYQYFSDFFNHFNGDEKEKVKKGLEFLFTDVTGGNTC